MKSFLIGLLMTISVLSWAQNLTFSVPPATVTGTYGPDNGLIVVSTMTIRHTGAACSYFITFSAGNSGVFTSRTATSGANKLNYQIYDNITNKNILENLTANPGQSNVLSGSFASGNATQIQTFTSYFAANQLPTSGTYTDSIRMDIYIGTVASHGASVRNRTYAVSITVPTLLDIAIVPTGSPFNVADGSMTFNFGTLSNGESLSADFMVRSNYLNTVKVTSTNGQVLKNTISGDTSQVPYTFAFNSGSVILPAGTPVNVVTSQPATPATGKRYPMSVTIGTVGWQTATTYTDIITFTATSN
jgi:hypothetical protein